MTIIDSVLNYITAHPGSTNQEIAKALGIKRGSLSWAVCRQAERGNIFATEGKWYPGKPSDSIDFALEKLQQPTEPVKPVARSKQSHPLLFTLSLLIYAVGGYVLGRWVV